MRRVVLSEVNEYDVLFQKSIYFNLEMEAWQIKAELKKAHFDLDKAMKEWKKKMKLDFEKEQRDIDARS